MYVVTFYSFKGGVGRTLALVNIGVELAQQGRRVLLVDFDLEAPGLETFDLLRHRETVPGVVEYVTQYLETSTAPNVSEFMYQTSGIGREGGHLWVMPSGKQDEAYGARFNALDWQELYDRHSGYLMFEDLKAQWQANLAPDYVLIDSRTGHTDVAGICTRQLPDAVVVMFFPNEQNLRGLKRIVSDIRGEARGPRKKAIQLHFVTSNVPDLDDEDRILARTLERFEEELGCRGPLTIHHYGSLALVNQAVFTHDRPSSGLTREYRELLKTIRQHNTEDPEGALEFLRLVGLRSRRPTIPATEIEERLKKIQESHPTNGRILYQVGLVRARQGYIEESINLLTEALNTGYGEPDLLLERAELYALTEQPAEALSDIWRVLDAADVTYFHVTRALHWLYKFAPQSLARVIGTRALQSLDPDGRLQVARELKRSHEALRVAEPILREVLETIDPTSSLHDRAETELVLCLIGLGRFQEAKSIISPVPPDPIDFGPLEAFNYAMAEWGVSGAPARELLERAIDWDRDTGSPERNPAHEQRMAMALWLVGKPDEARSRLRRARQQLRTYGPRLFSVWRYQEVSKATFLKDLEEMEQGFKDRALAPAFLGEAAPPSSKDE